MESFNTPFIGLTIMGYEPLLQKCKCFTGKYTTCKIHTKPHPGLGWRIFHILTIEDIDDFTEIVLDPYCN